MMKWLSSRAIWLDVNVRHEQSRPRTPRVPFSFGVWSTGGLAVSASTMGAVSTLREPEKAPSPDVVRLFCLQQGSAAEPCPLQIDGST